MVFQASNDIKVSGERSESAASALLDALRSVLLELLELLTEGSDPLRCYVDVLNDCPEVLVKCIDMTLVYL